MSRVSIMDPDGIVKACTANWRITRASSTAMMIASAYSRNSDFLRIFAAGPAIEAGASERAEASERVRKSLMVSALEDRQERLLRHLDPPDLFHAFLPFLLLLEQLALAGDVAAIALGRHVLAHGLDGLPGDHAAADRRLDRDLVELARDHAPELLRERLALLVGLLTVDDDA